MYKLPFFPFKYFQCRRDTYSYFKYNIIDEITGVTLAQLVKASVGQADVEWFEPHLGHNWLSCDVFLVKSRHFGLPLAQSTMAKFAVSLCEWLGHYTNVEYLQSLYLKR